MVELGNDQRFLIEQLLRQVIPEMFRGQKLDRDGAVERGLVAAINCCHAAPADTGEIGVTVELQVF